MQGGLRLAAVLNTILAPAGSQQAHGDNQDLINLQWLYDTEA